MTTEQTTIEQGNKLIAEFMDFDWHEAEKYKDGLPKYHSSWDWLMPVVEKIEEMGYQTFLKKHMNRKKQGYEMLFYDKNNGDLIIEADFGYKSKIDCVWQATISFVQWYNQNKKQ